ncbi:MAG TPA: ABC transporter ATP-binding protein [Arachnia sp.]|nr:ABC transporter ATP-binding protein [Arachnia sp.]
MRAASRPAGDERWGAFEAPASPPAEPRLRVDPDWSPRRLSAALLRGVWPWMLSGSLLLVVHNVAGMLLPVAIGGLVDGVVAPAFSGTAPAELRGALLAWAGVLAGLYVVVHVGYRFGGRLGWFGVQRSQYELSQAVLGRVLDRRGMAGPARPPGGLLAVATGDVHRACLVLYVTVYPPGEAIGLMVSAAVLFAIHPALGAGVVVGLPLALVLMHLAARPLRRSSLAEQQGLADAAAAAADLVAGYRVLRGLHAQRTAASRYRGVSREALGATLRARAAEAGFEAISTAVSQLFAAALALAAAMLALDGRITVGQLVTVAGIAVVLVGPLDTLTGTLGSIWAVSQASAQRVLDLLSSSPNPASLGARKPAETGAAPVFSRLALPGGGLLDAAVDPGRFVVLDVAHDAHSFLADVLSARLVPGSGQATLAGTPVHLHDPGALRERLLVVPHTPGILGGTVLDNARATGESPVDAERAASALRVAGLLERELPDGYGTAVGDGGWELSGGQRQRIALARAVAASPEVLVLIEPTTSVDAVTEQRIARALAAHRKGRTTVVLTASPAFRAVADEIVGLACEEVGTHA